ncbi:hypothetical protein [Roseiflexus sp.]|uniref:hypothetical protein n=1 Tax=Roseiflexus sp. TaxID=2562120 RepID=UPI00398AB118
MPAPLNHIRHHGHTARAVEVCPSFDCRAVVDVRGKAFNLWNRIAGIGGGKYPYRLGL